MNPQRRTLFIALSLLAIGYLASLGYIIRQRRVSQQFS